MNRANRILPPQAFQTFAIRAPLDTHWRPGTCEEDDCEAYLNGFFLDIDESDRRALGGAARAHYMRHDNTRTCTEERLPNGLTRFLFPPGNRCFGRHLVRSDRPALYVARGGDQRGNPLGTRTLHTKPEHWIENFQESLDKVRHDREKG